MYISPTSQSTRLILKRTILGDEAAESAVDKSKFLLNRVIGRKILPENSEDDEEKEASCDTLN